MTSITFSEVAVNTGVIGAKLCKSMFKGRIHEEVTRNWNE